MPQEAERLAALAQSSDGDPPDLLEQMIGLRRDLGKERRKHLRDRIAAVLIILVALLLWNGERMALDRIRTARTQGRQATCQTFAAFAQAFATATHARQDQIDPFVVDVNHRLSGLGCQITVTAGG